MLEDQIGLEGPQYEVDIERGKIREFARAMGAPLEEFCTGRHPVVPPTFMVSLPYTWGYTLERPRGTAFKNIKHDLTVSLHAAEALTFHKAPPRAGEQLIAQARLSDVKRKTGRSGGDLVFLEMTTRYSDLDGNLRVEQKSTSVITEQEPGSGEWTIDLPVYDPSYTKLEIETPFRDIKRSKIQLLEVGKGPGQIRTPPLTQHDIVRFQSVVGEDDPLHYDQQWARKQGYPSVFALGMHQASQMAAYVSHWLPPERIRKFNVRFKNISWPGDRFVFNGYVEKIDTKNKLASIHLTCKRMGGDMINEAWATFEI